MPNSQPSFFVPVHPWSMNTTQQTTCQTTLMHLSTNWISLYVLTKATFSAWYLISGNETIVHIYTLTGSHTSNEWLQALFRTHHKVNNKRV